MTRSELLIARCSARSTAISSWAGGIREVEFITQTFQLIRGGRDFRLQTQSLQQALQQLAADGVLPPEDVEGLWLAYEFLRNTEHALQGIADKQTQQLPEDELGQQRVATILGFENWQTLKSACGIIANMLKKSLPISLPIRNRPQRVSKRASLQPTVKTGCSRMQLRSLIWKGWDILRQRMLPDNCTACTGAKRFWGWMQNLAAVSID